MPWFLGRGKIQLFLCQADAAACSQAKRSREVSCPPHPGHGLPCACSRLHGSNPAKSMLLLSRHSGLCSWSPCHFPVPSCCTWRFLAWQHCSCQLHGCQLHASSVPASPSHPFTSSPAAPLPQILGIHGNELFTLPVSWRNYFFQNRLTFFSDYFLPTLHSKKF